eukprot:UN00918
MFRPGKRFGIPQIPHIWFYMVFCNIVPFYTFSSTILKKCQYFRSWVYMKVIYYLRY